MAARCNKIIALLNENQSASRYIIVDHVVSSLLSDSPPVGLEFLTFKTCQH
jgi:hypothetical protein